MAGEGKENQGSLCVGCFFFPLINWMDRQLTRKGGGRFAEGFLFMPPIKVNAGKPPDSCPGLWETKFQAIHRRLSLFLPSDKQCNYMLIGTKDCVGCQGSCQSPRWEWMEGGMEA